jgi:hypothetical protein
MVIALAEYAYVHETDVVKCSRLYRDPFPPSSLTYVNRCIGYHNPT